MANENERDSWELEHGRPHRDAEESNSNAAKEDIEQPESDEAEKSLWEPEPGIDYGRLYSPNITPEVLKNEWKNYVLQAAKEAIHIAETRGRVYMLVRQWDEDNEPRVPALDLARLTEWALDTWAPEFKRT